jgi:predicted Zn-dependent protease
VTARALIIVALLVAACRNPDGAKPAGERFVAAEEGISFTVPAGWSAHRDRGAVIFTSTRHAKRTLVIRAVPRGRKEGAALVEATAVAIAGLPGVQVTSRAPVDGGLGGTAFELTFVPPGLDARYARTHVVLVGENHDRIYHVLDTAPADARPHDDLVATLVASFREEV